MENDNAVAVASFSSMPGFSAPKLHPATTWSSPMLQKDEKDLELKIKTCYACKKLIVEEYIMRVADLSWHADCLRCLKCGVQLIEKCYFKQGHLYCTPDYHREFSIRCTVCHEVLNQSELVQRAGCYIYHLRCFHCAICDQQLSKGDKFYLLYDTGSLVCTLDYETNKYRDLDNGNKRPRTTISSKQLEALKIAYGESSKPPRHVRERLSIQTGLDMRVVQVWFQNRRAKERRLSKDSRGEPVYAYEWLLDGMPPMLPSCSMWPFQSPRVAKAAVAAPICHSL